MEMLSKYTSSLSFYGRYLLDARRRTYHCSSQLVWYKSLFLFSLVLRFHPTSIPSTFLLSFFHPSIPPPSSSFPHSVNKHPTSLYRPSIVVILIPIPSNDHLNATGAIRCLYDLISAAPTRKVFDMTHTVSEMPFLST